MSLDDDRVRLAYLTGRLDDGFALWVTEARDLIRMAEDGIAAREEAERLRALCDDDLRRHRVGRDVVDALVAERDAALAAIRAVEALVIEADAAHGFIVPANVTTERIRTAIRDALEAR